MQALSFYFKKNRIDPFQPGPSYYTFPNLPPKLGNKYFFKVISKVSILYFFSFVKGKSFCFSHS